VTDKCRCRKGTLCSRCLGILAAPARVVRRRCRLARLLDAFDRIIEGGR